jgi:hypothetical protein
VGIATSPEFYDQVVRREFLGRFTVGAEAVHRNQPVYFYLLHILRDFFPWSLVLVAAACVRDVREKLRRDPALLWLVCWAVGGLVFMSLVPSKRGDRIFPIYPPLCLLVPAVVAWWPSRLLPRLNALTRVLALLGVATLVSGGYTMYRFVVSGRSNAQALVEFGAQVRQLSFAERRAAIAGKDEGMLLYLDLTHFTDWDDAEAQWKSGAIECLVLPQAYEKRAISRFPGASLAYTSETAKGKFSRYICLLRLIGAPEE